MALQIGPSRPPASVSPFLSFSAALDRKDREPRLGRERLESRVSRPLRAGTGVDCPPAFILSHPIRLASMPVWNGTPVPNRRPQPGGRFWAQAPDRLGDPAVHRHRWLDGA